MKNLIHIITEDEAFQWAYPGTDAEFTLRRLPAVKRAELTRKHTRPDGTVDEAAYQADVLDYCLQAWNDAVTHPTTGKPVPCTRAHKLALPPKAQAGIFLQTGLNALPDKDQEGNFETSPASEAGTQG